jgi:hypothetical protein
MKINKQIDKILNVKLVSTSDLTGAIYFGPYFICFWHLHLGIWFAASKVRKVDLYELYIFIFRQQSIFCILQFLYQYKVRRGHKNDCAKGPRRILILQ